MSEKEVASAEKQQLSLTKADLTVWRHWVNKNFLLVGIPLSSIALMAVALLPPALSNFASLIRTVGFLLILAAFMYALARPRAPDEAGDWRSVFRYLSEVTLATFVAVAFAATQLRGGGSLLQDIPEQWASIIAVSIVMTGIAVVSNAARSIAEARSSIEEARKAFSEETSNANALYQQGRELVGNLTETIDKADFVPLAATVLELHSSALRDSEARPAIGAALSTIRTWFNASHKSFDQASTGSEAPRTEVGQRSWWKCLTTYHQEEKYDLARFELVTNVRNYAYVLISAVEEFRRSAQNVTTENADRGAGDQQLKASEKEVVIVQQSPFPPKDFYNFPFGTKGVTRSYFDAEFYGVYRRATQFVYADPLVFPHRILLADATRPRPMKSASDDAASQPHLRELGWALDSVYDMVLGSARLLCSPYALPLSVVKGGWARDRHLFAQVFRSGWSPQSSDDPTPYYCPVIPITQDDTVGDDFRLHQEPWLSQARKPLRDARNKFGFKDLPYDVQVGGPAVRWANNQDPLDICELNAWNRIQEQRSKLDGKLCGDDRHKRDLSELRKQFNSLSQFRARIRQLPQDSNVKMHGEISGIVGGLVETSQGLDAILADLGAHAEANGPTDGAAAKEAPRSVHGLTMGPAENWLYHALNLLDFKSFQSSVVAGQNFRPVWELFCSDMLGFGRGAAKDVHPARDSARVLRRLRVVPVVHEPHPLSTDNESDQAPTSEDVRTVPAPEMMKRGISSEFTLIGLRDRSSSEERPTNFDGVEWHLLITSEISEPFSTCRLTFSLRDHNQAELKKHSDWVKEVWKEQESFSEGVISDVIAALPLSDKLVGPTLGA